MSAISKLTEFELDPETGTTTCMAISSQYGSFFGVGTSSGYVNLYLVGNQTPILQFKPIMNAQCPIISLALDPLEQTLLAAHKNGVVAIWDLESESLLRYFENKPCQAIAVHPFGVLFALLYEDNVEIRNMKDRECVAIYQIPSKYRPATSFRFTPDGLNLFVGCSFSQGALIIFDLQSGQYIESPVISKNTTKNPGKVASITSIKFHPTHLLTCVGTSHGDVLLYSNNSNKFITLSSLEELRTAAGISIRDKRDTPFAAALHTLSTDNIIFTTDSSGVVVAKSNSIITWSLKSILMNDALLTGDEEIFSDKILPFSVHSNVLLGIGYDHFLIVNAYDEKSISTWYLNLRKIGLCISCDSENISTLSTTPTNTSTQSSPLIQNNETQNHSKSTLTDIEKVTSTQFITTKQTPSVDESSGTDDSFMHKTNTQVGIQSIHILEDLETSMSRGQLYYDLKDRLDHLRQYRLLWSGKSELGFISSLSKLSSKSRISVLSELLANQLLEQSYKLHSNSDDILPLLQSLRTLWKEQVQLKKSSSSTSTKTNQISHSPLVIKIIAMIQLIIDVHSSQISAEKLNELKQELIGSIEIFPEVNIQLQNLITSFSTIEK